MKLRRLEITHIHTYHTITSVCITPGRHIVLKTYRTMVAIPEDDARRPPYSITKLAVSGLASTVITPDQGQYQSQANMKAVLKSEDCEGHYVVKCHPDSYPDVKYPANKYEREEPINSRKVQPKSIPIMLKEQQSAYLYRVVCYVAVAILLILIRIEDEIHTKSKV